MYASKLSQQAKHYERERGTETDREKDRERGIITIQELELQITSIYFICCEKQDWVNPLCWNTTIQIPKLDLNTM